MTHQTRDPFAALMKDWLALGPFAAQVVSTRLAMLPWLAMTSPQEAVEETRLMFAEKHSALAETQLRAAWLPWLVGMRALLAPMGLATALGPMLVGALVTPSRRRVHANIRRLKKLPPISMPLRPIAALDAPMVRR